MQHNTQVPAGKHNDRQHASPHHEVATDVKQMPIRPIIFCNICVDMFSSQRCLIHAAYEDYRVYDHFQPCTIWKQWDDSSSHPWYKLSMSTIPLWISIIMIYHFMILSPLPPHRPMTNWTRTGNHVHYLLRPAWRSQIFFIRYLCAGRNISGNYSDVTWSSATRVFVQQFVRTNIT